MASAPSCITSGDGPANSGDLTEGNSTEVAQQIWSAMHGAVSLEIAGVHFAADRAANYMAMIEAMLIGLSRKV